jgi:hypothetical protein
MKAVGAILRDPISQMRFVRAWHRQAVSKLT